MNELAAIVREARAALAAGTPAVLATIVGTRGSSYRRPGARMLVTAQGWRAGSISGGCLEAEVVRQAAFLVQRGRAVVRRYDTSEDAPARLGCGGEVDVLLEPIVESGFVEQLARVVERREAIEVRTVIEGRVGEREVFAGGVRVFSTNSESRGNEAVFVESIRPAQRLVVIGAGHDAMPVARLADGLGWSVVVVDWRPHLLAKERFPEAERVLSTASELVARVPLESGTIAVVLSHHLDYDAAALSLLLRSPAVVATGLLGPRHRAAQVLALAESLGGPLGADARDRLRAPVGLDLGAEGPDAIALSIVAEAQSVLAGRTAAPLSRLVGAAPA